MRSVEQQITRLFVCHVAVGLGLACIAIALGMFGWDGYVWWRDGTWKLLNVSDLASLFPEIGHLFSVPTADMPKLRFATALLGSVPVAAVGLIFGWIVMSRALSASDEASRRLDLLRRLEAR